MRTTRHHSGAGKVAIPDSLTGLSALAILLEALTVAVAHRRSPWQYAVEMERLLAAGATVEMLRC